jgi:tetratricopeptide (TPR) repeat protein
MKGARRLPTIALAAPALVLLPPLLLLSLLLSACRPAPPPEASQESLFAALPEGLLSSPVGLDGGCGAVHQETGSPSPKAQAYYDQGLACLGTFDWVRAARSFHGALAQDPSLAVAYSGLARAYLALEEPRLALGWARQGGELARNSGNAWTRAWTALAEAQMVAVLASPSDPRHLAAYRRQLEAHLASDPRDPHTLCLLGHAWSRADDWGQGGGEASLAWYRRALKADPDFFPAHHFLAHTLENLGLYEEALIRARRFAELAPEAPHAHHMLAHTAPRRGRWPEALEALQTADALHRARFEAAELPPAADWHYSHNLRLLAAVAQRLEQPELARQALRRTFELPIGGSRGGFYCGPWIEFLLLEKDTERALSAAEACLQRPSALAQVLGSSYRGEALLDLKRPAEARSALSQAQASLRRWTSTLGPVSTERTLAAVAGRTVAILEAKLAVVDGSRRQGEELLASLGEELAQGKSFDAWASGRGRLQELQGWAVAHQAPLPARRLAAALASLDDQAATGLAGPDPGGRGSASACH